MLMKMKMKGLYVQNTFCSSIMMTSQMIHHRYQKPQAKPLNSWLSFLSTRRVKSQLYKEIDQIYNQLEIIYIQKTYLGSEYTAYQSINENKNADTTRYKKGLIISQFLSASFQTYIPITTPINVDIQFANHHDPRVNQ